MLSILPTVNRISKLLRKLNEQVHLTAPLQQTARPKADQKLNICLGSLSRPSSKLRLLDEAELRFVLS